MKLFIALLLVVSGYVFYMMKSATVAMSLSDNLQQQYLQVAGK